MVEIDSPSKVPLLQASDLPEEAQVDVPGIHGSVNRLIEAFEVLIPKEIKAPFGSYLMQLTQDQRYAIIISSKKEIAKVEIQNPENVCHSSIKYQNPNSFALLDEWNVAIGHQKSIYLIDIRDPENSEQVLKGHTKKIMDLKIVGSDLYSLSEDCTIRKWNLNDLSHEVFVESEIPITAFGVTDELIAYATQDNANHVLSTTTKEQVKKLTMNFPAIALTLKGDYLAYANENGLVTVWQTSTWKKIKNMTAKGFKIICIDINDTWLACGTSQGSLHIVKLWEKGSMPYNRIEPVFRTHSVQISTTYNAIFYCANVRQSIQYIPIQEFPTNKKIKSEGPIQFSSVHTLKRRPIMILQLVQKKIQIWNIEEMELVNEYTAFNNKNALGVTPDERFFMTTAKDNHICKVNIDDLSQEVLFQREETRPISTIHISARYVFIGDEESRVGIYDMGQKAKVASFKVRKYTINCLLCSSDETMLFAGEFGGTLRMFDLTDMKSQPLPIPFDGSNAYGYIRIKFDWHHKEFSGIVAMALSSDNKYLVTGSTDYLIKVWYTSSRALCCEIKSELPICNEIYFYPETPYLMVSTNDMKTGVCRVGLLHFPSKTWITYKDHHPEYITGLAGNWGKDFIAVGKNGIQVTKNPLFNDSPQVFGPKDDTGRMCFYVRDMKNGKIQEYDPQMDYCVFAPGLISPLHLYTFYAYKNMLEPCIQNNPAYFESRDGHSPLSIAISQNYSDTVEFILKNYFIANLNPHNNYPLTMLEPYINELNMIGPDSLLDLYENGFYKIEDTLLPKFCGEEVDLPIVVHKDQFEAVTSDYFETSEDGQFGANVEFFQFGCPIGFHPGSEESLGFLNSLLKSSNTEIFRTEFIQSILEFKWNHIRSLLFIQGGVYTVYLVFLSLLMIAYLEEDWIYITLFVINLFLFAYEVLQMFVTGKDYFSDIWNYIDLIRVGLLTVVCGLRWTGISLGVTMNIISLLMLFSWIRGLTYFRLFQKTRYMVYLILQVCVDMVGFLILFIYSTLAFCFVYLCIDYRQEAGDVFYYFLYSYKMGLGDFDSGEFNGLAWVMFFFASLINMIVMLNLLISIMGDTYDKVQEASVIADNRELAEMILEGESLLFWNRKKNYKQFFSVCKEKTSSEEGDVWEGRVREIKKKIFAIHNNINTEFVNIKNDFAVLKGSLQRIHVKTKHVHEGVRKWKEENKEKVAPEGKPKKKLKGKKKTAKEAPEEQKAKEAPEEQKEETKEETN